MRLTKKQWNGALSEEWVDDSNYMGDMLVTYQTGKGPNHLVPIMFPPETLPAMTFLTDQKNRLNAGVLPSNEYLFASAMKSENHRSGWHAINDILMKLYLKGTINATRNHQRVASLLAKLHLTDKAKELIYTHFGHSESMNKNWYQAAAGTMKLQTTGKRLIEIHDNNMRNKQLAND